MVVDMTNNMIIFCAKFKVKLFHEDGTWYPDYWKCPNCKFEVYESSEY